MILLASRSFSGGDDSHRRLDVVMLVLASVMIFGLIWFYSYSSQLLEARSFNWRMYSLNVS